MKILIVDDEPQIRKLIQAGLAGFGYEVITAVNGSDALTQIAIDNPELVIMDIALGAPPDGIAVCRQLREWSNVPVIMLSIRTEERIKVEALNVGADDYMTKPFGMSELDARIQAILRRGSDNYISATDGKLRLGQLVIDQVNHRVWVGQDEVHLTPKEFSVLHLLATNTGKVVTHRTLLQKVWGTTDNNMDHYVRVFVNQLRKKLHENPARNVRYIINEPGIGYRFVMPE